MFKFKDFIKEGFVYNTRKIPKKGNYNGKSDVDPHEHYLKHYASNLMLHKISKNASFNDKFDIEKEISMSDKKMKHWASKPNFNYEKVSKQLQSLKKHFK